MERKYAWHNYDEQTLQDVMSLGDSYRQFLDNGVRLVSEWQGCHLLALVAQLWLGNELSSRRL